MKRPILVLVFLTAVLGFSACCCPEPNGPGGFKPDGIVTISPPPCTLDSCIAEATRLCASHLASGVFCNGTRCSYQCVRS
jgi:hypothetical protein